MTKYLLFLRLHVFSFLSASEVPEQVENLRSSESSEGKNKMA